MLKTIHKYQKSFIFYIFAGLIAMAMLGFGVDFLGTGSNQGYAIKVDDKEINFTDFSNERRQIEERLRSQFGDFYSQLLSSGGINLDQQTVDVVIRNSLLDKAADNFDLYVGSNQLRNFLDQSFGGDFNQESYRALLSQLRTTSTAFEASISDDIRRAQFFDIFSDVSSASAIEAKTLLERDETQYNVDYVEFDPKEYEAKVSVPEDSVLEEFYNENVTDYELEQRVSYDYVVLKPEENLDIVEVLPEDIEVYYADRLQDYTQEEQVKLRMIKLNFPADLNPAEIAKVRTLAEKIHKDAQSGKDFAKLATKNSEDAATKKKGGDLGWVIRGSNEKELDDIFFSNLALGITAPIETANAVYILKVEDYKPHEVKSLDSVKADIEKIIQKREAPAYTLVRAQELFDIWSTSEKSLEEFAKENKLKLSKTPELYVASKDAEASLSGLTKQVLVFPEETKKLIEIQENTILAEVKEYKEREYPQFKDVKDKVVTNYKQKESVSLAKQTAEDLISAFEDQVALKEVAKKLKLKINTHKDMKSTNPGSPVLGNPFISKVIYRASTPLQKPTEVIEALNKYYVVQVTAINKPKLEDIKDKLESYKTRAVRDNAQVLLASFVNKLKASSEIDIDPSLLSEG